MELHNDEKRLLKAFKDSAKNIIDSEGLLEYIEKEKIMRAAFWLTGRDFLNIIEKKSKFLELTELGKNAIESGFPERKVSNYLKTNKLDSFPIKDLSKVLEKDEAGAALGNLKKKELVTIEKGNIFFKSLEYKDLEEELLKKVSLYPNLEEYSKEEILTIETLKKRGFLKLNEVTEREFEITVKGLEYIKNPIEIKEEVTQITRDLIVSGKWKEVSIRPYDAKIPTEEIYPAKAHPMSKIIEEVTEVLTSMGFSEVKSQIVQTEFWNFDTLFEPQDHPARDMQDTFFVKYPDTGIVPHELLKKVKSIHECGKIENEKISKGWCYKFDEEVSKRTVLRTHTTVSSIKYLSSLSNEEKENFHKVFCIDRVFRNETIDYKHLPEFYQCEGIIMAEDVSFNNLVGILKEFLSKLGFEKVRIRPAYFPFTEPSLEAEVYMEGKGWLELLGAGIFRPEVLEPFGIKKPVLAWGIGLSRLAMLRLGLTDIRELHKNDIEWLKKTVVIEK
ncbi:phenylalanyl-tRNA synthetase, alpha subunit [Methanococcus vannielii SB]|jgi:phenylalanyl-tRNA synthetase alpha chain|uniref:Phenylalanine--tRNA ligase alpha subunit n=1 Tax=Methanococcus vannielii (strain ATCC 35089 / DSM 1224 / JCM 13029 / OCM 148 / SB) TaxID=406327 RepID=SYFA_METVS|nr:phenylalanine--tRNA ligase subunit alpha [Methanococcus vannielii]A6UQD9.1 RecName: Full=Phenylalanine--tRNA ligase alpha subunit; AltName: Full=Phenylalanyl-tRNA synthetase alpha subunit; Short=PheRS [Methanococcus vannielii SB]ABR54711.1 phenylalanyl-tRNA synthetase, alpha subunit [Methanococcus vannielii SB]